MFQANQGISPLPLHGQGLKIAIVQARFNAHLTDAMAQHCLAALHEMGVNPQDIRHIQVPGALEIPVALQALAAHETADYDALIALGCVIRGGTYHFELVCNESGRGVSQVSLDYGIPIANAILTLETESQALERVPAKARDAAHVAVEMARLLEQL